MAESLKFAVPLSFQEIALRKVIGLLFNDNNILATILYFLEFQCQVLKEWKIGSDILDKISKLNLPTSLSDLVIDNILTFGLEIKKWKNVHKEFFKPSPTVYKHVELCWTTAGTIDYRKTAIQLVHCDKLSVEQRYRIACQYCLEDDIPHLWGELSNSMKEYYLNEGSYFDLEFCWPYILKGDFTYLDLLWIVSDRNLTSFNQWAFEHSAEHGNISASEYFFKKLTSDEKETSILRTGQCVPGYRNSCYWLAGRGLDILKFLLSLMTPQQQMEIVKARPVDVLLCFLDSPRSDLFVANADLIWAHLPPSDYEDLLQKLAKFNFSDFYFPKLLQEFLKRSPVSFKRYFVEGGYFYPDSPVSRFVEMFMESENSESLKVIFRNIDAPDRVNLMFQENMLELFCNCIMIDKLHMLEVCVREAALTRNDRERLKETFEHYLYYAGLIGIENINYQFRWLLQSFDETNTCSDT